MDTKIWSSFRIIRILFSFNSNFNYVFLCIAVKVNRYIYCQY